MSLHSVEEVNQQVSDAILQVPCKETFARLIQTCYRFEKLTRLNDDVQSVCRMLCLIVDLCIWLQDEHSLEANLSTCLKKRGQFKTASVAMIKHAIEGASDSIKKIPLLEAIVRVSEGRVILEVERARACKVYANALVSEGRLKDALMCMIEVPVETFTSMDRPEMLQMIIDQLRLAILTADWSVLSVILRKITPKHFDGEFSNVSKEQICQLKRQFFEAKLAYDVHQADYLLAVEDCQILSELNQENTELKIAALLYCLLANFECRQQNTLQECKKRLGDTEPMAATVAALFETDEMINSSEFVAKFSEFLRNPALLVFEAKSKEGNDRWQALVEKIHEHNVRIASKCYSRITIERLSQLLKQSRERTEEILCKLIVEQSVTGKINRPLGLVSFVPAASEDEKNLESWTDRVRSVLHLTDSVCQLIAKEKMLHALSSK